MQHKRQTHLTINPNISGHGHPEGKVSQHNLDLIKNMFRPGEKGGANNSEYAHSGMWDAASVMRSVSGITDNNQDKSR